MTQLNGPLRIGIGGPVGAGKTTLTAALAAALKDQHSIGVITNDIYTQEDAEELMRRQILPQDRIIGVETGGCPHTAIREDASINLAAVAEMRDRHPEVEAILIESGGDNLSATFSPETCGHHALCHRHGRGRGNPAQGWTGDHQIRPADHQQDRPRPTCGRLA